MSEKRKPKYTILLKRAGKKKSHKIELFESKLWADNMPFRETLRHLLECDRFRVRIDGKWLPEKATEQGKIEFFTTTRIKELIFRNIQAKPRGRR